MATAYFVTSNTVNRSYLKPLLVVGHGQRVGALSSRITETPYNMWIVTNPCILNGNVELVCEGHGKSQLLSVGLIS